MNSTVRRLIGEITPYKKAVVIVALTGILFSAAYSRLALFVGELQSAFQSGNSEQVRDIAIKAMSLAFIVAVTRYFHIFTMNVTAERVVNDLRTRLQTKFMKLSLGFHSAYEFGSGGLMSRIMNDVKVIQDGLRMIADFFREPLLAILLLGNLFYLNWKLTLTLLIALPLVLYFLRQISRGLRKYVLHGQENLEQITSTIKESLDGVRTIQSFNLEKVMGEKLQKQTGDYLNLRRKIHSRIEVMGPVTEFVATGMILGIFLYFSSADQGTHQAGDILAYVTSMLMINVPIKKLQESYVRIQETVVAADRVYQILDEPSEVPAGHKNLSFPQNWSKIVYQNVSFSYGNHLTLKNLNLEIKRGQQVALVGESGSGKSTLVNLLGRFYDPTEGEIFIDQTPLRDFDLKDLRRHVALVSQDVFLFSDSIERNIHAGDFNRDVKHVQQSALTANAHDFIMRTKEGYKSQAGDRGSLLSGGEKQRVSIARALFKDAPVLILDEATSALDSASEQEVQKGLDQLMKGRTCLIVAHRLSTIQNADRIIVMKDGQIAEDGTHADLLSRQGAYHRFWSLQAKA